MDRSYKITTNGAAVIAACLAGGKPLTLTRAAVGSGILPEGTDLRDVHTLISYVATATVGERIRVGNSFHTSVQYSNKSDPGRGAFTLTEFMLYATDPETESETDLAYGYLGDYAQPVPAFQNGVPESIFTYPLILALSSDLTVKVTASPGVVTYPDLMSMIESGYLGTVKEEISVPAETWAEDEAPEVPGYPWHADVELEKLTGDEVPTVVFHDPGKARTVAPVAKTVAKALRLYAVSAPEEELAATVTFSAGTAYAGSGQDPGPWELKPATKTRIGGVMPGDDFTVDAQGHLSINTERVLTRDAVAPADEVVREIAPLLGGEVQ